MTPAGISSFLVRNTLRDLLFPKPPQGCRVERPSWGGLGQSGLVLLPLSAEQLVTPRQKVSVSELMTSSLWPREQSPSRAMFELASLTEGRKESEMGDLCSSI